MQIDQIIKRLKSFSSGFPRFTYSECCFSMNYLSRHVDGKRSTIPIKGTLTDTQSGVEVVLRVQAGWEFLLGCLIVLVGIVGLIVGILTSSPKTVVFAGSIGVGLLISVTYYWQSIQCLERLEEKLQETP